MGSNEFGVCENRMDAIVFQKYPTYSGLCGPAIVVQSKVPFLTRVPPGTIVGLRHPRLRSMSTSPATFVGDAL
jgi:hypothetical protein